MSINQPREWQFAEIFLDYLLIIRLLDAVAELTELTNL
jgi:hypothetical protein